MSSTVRGPAAASAEPVNSALAEVPGPVRAARVVVALYLRPSQSGVVHLALRHARPLVSTDVGDLAEAVRDGESGLLVPPGDVAALARALGRLLFAQPTHTPADLARAHTERVPHRSRSPWGAPLGGAAMVVAPAPSGGEDSQLEFGDRVDV